MKGEAEAGAVAGSVADPDLESGAFSTLRSQPIFPRAQFQFLGKK